MSKINLNSQFDVYLARVGVSEDMLPDFQYQEMKRAFMGGIGQILVAMQFEQQAISDDPKSQALVEDMFAQMETYWQQENEKDRKANLPQKQDNGK